MVGRKELAPIIDSVASHIGVLRKSGHVVAARLLEMAKLEMMLQYHDIAEDELTQLCEYLQNDKPRSSRSQ